MPPLRPLLVAAALLAVGVGQGVAVTRTPELPAGIELTALPNGYSYATRDDRLVVVGFQMQNTGDVGVRLRDLAADLPGLELADVVVSGEPFRFMSAGEGAEPVPPFDLEPGVVIEVSLAYRLVACPKVPEDSRPMPVAASVGRARGLLQVPLPTAPADDEDAGPDDEEQWQRVLVRDLCG